MRINFDTKKHKDSMYGTTTVGARGQVVIPAEARKQMGLKPGDHLLVIGKLGKVLALIKADQLEDIIQTIMESAVGKESKSEIKKHIENLLGPINI